ncbi:hypothetical protein A2U01_0101895, partial [Trifolium medium]|nr:hypothetical protein [Trifolium medium]
QEDVFVMFASLIMEEKSEVDSLPVVCEFADVFPDDISDLHPKGKSSFLLTYYRELVQSLWHRIGCQLPRLRS